MLSFLGDKWLYTYIVISSVLSTAHVLVLLNCGDFFSTLSARRGCMLSTVILTT